MPRIVRPMYADPGDGLPITGSHKRCLLGVRPTGQNADVDLNPAGDVTGNVVVNHKGLSVTSDWRLLKPYMIPMELDDGLIGASGIGMKVFVHGNGAFVAGPMAAGLEMILKAHSVDSGVVRPTATVALTQYQDDLRTTRAQWVEDPS